MKNTKHLIYAKTHSCGQAAVMDALFFMIVCSGAAVLLFSVAGAYNVNTNRQITTIYNYEFASNVLVSMHMIMYDDISTGEKKRLWVDINKALAKDYPAYLDEIKNILTKSYFWKSLKETSPSPNPWLCFETLAVKASFCCFEKKGALMCDDSAQIEPGKTVFSAAVGTRDSDGIRWTVTLKLIY